jgi:enoyl-CoA hydratase
VAILTGAGRAFCAGVDLKELSGSDGVLQQADAVEGAGHIRFGMRAFKGPVIAAINGFAMTGGLELALNCDIRIASTAARFADTHARVGVIPGGRMSALLPRLIGLSRAKEMSLSGRMIDAETAERWGLVNRIVAPENLMAEALALAEDIARNDPGIVRVYNALIDAGYGMTYAAAIDHEHITSRDSNQRFQREALDASAVAARMRDA